MQKAKRNEKTKKQQGEEKEEALSQHATGKRGEHRQLRVNHKEKAEEKETQKAIG